MVHFHASPVRTGASSMNRFLNKKCRGKMRRYHARTRRGVCAMRKVIRKYRKGGFLRSKHRRSVSSEQPWNASVRNRWGTYGYPELVSRGRNMIVGVNGCVCGLRIKGVPSCKRWSIQTDNPSLAGVLAHLRCDGGHDKVKSIGGKTLQATGRYPRSFGRLFVMALMLKWYKRRDWAV